MKKQTLAKILIPLKDNEGNVFNNSQFEYIKEKALSLFHGYLISDSPNIQGAWKDIEGSKDLNNPDVYYDQLFTLSITLDSSLGEKEFNLRVETLIDHIKYTFSQLAVFVEWSECSII
jgi:hypothetical protein